MGAVCSSGTLKETQKSNGDEVEKGSGFSGKLKSMASLGKLKKRNDDSYTYADEIDLFEKAPLNLFDSGELHLSISQELKPSTPARAPANKGPHATSFLGKAGSASLEKAVEVLDTLGSSMTNFNTGGFSTGVTSRGNKISILAFEVANTIVKGATLLQSLSEENVRFLKKEILNSEGVQQLISTHVDELLSIAAADKREELKVFSCEVIRFGNMCKDPQWHNLDRFFVKWDLDTETNKQPREEAEMTMHELTSLAQHTSELYHEFGALKRFEQDYEHKLEEVDSLHLPRKGESLSILQSELKHQRKLVRSLQKKSLWSKSLEQVVEKLVDIVTFVHQEISEVFGDNGLPSAEKGSSNKPERLGAAGLALHYANIITQIDNIASRPTVLPPNMRDSLYNGLPPNVKAALRSRLHLDAKETLTAPQIKSEMEKSLKWLVPLASDTVKAHQGFGWVGEWANTGHDFGKKSSTPTNVVRLQTLYHADKNKVESHILELLSLLHRLISLVRYRDSGYRAAPAPARSPISKGSNTNAQLSTEDRNLLEEVMTRRRKLLSGVSKSQEFISPVRSKTNSTLSRSTGSSPRREPKHQKADVLDILDGLDPSFSFNQNDFR